MDKTDKETPSDVQRSHAEVNYSLLSLVRGLDGRQAPITSAPSVNKMLNLKSQFMGSKPKKVLKVVSGWDAVELILQCFIYGLYQLVKIAFRRLWKGHRRRPSKNYPPVEFTVDSSVGTHCYIKIMGVKYHYVEAGPKTGDIFLVLGDAPDPGLIHTPGWSQVVRRLTDSGHRVVTLDLRGCGGSESGSRADLSPPRVVEELHMMLQALGVSEHRPAVVIGHGIGGMLAWYLVHSHGSWVRKFVVVDAPHPSLYWQYPPAAFCASALHFVQWPYLPERWLAASQSGDESQRWANSRAADWSGALNYVRGAAWWQISPDRRAEPQALLVARGSQAAQLVASAERCLAPTLRLIREESEISAVLQDFLIEKDAVDAADSERRSTLVGRMFGAVGAVAGRGRELSARLLPPAPAATEQGFLNGF